MEILRGATIVDGTGGPSRQGDVVIDDGLIVSVEAPGSATGGEVVDLSGLVLAPGFIDCHTHYDAQVLWDPALTPSCWHGVTTVLMGNCGFGIAPTRPEDRETIARTLENVEGMSLESLVEGIDWTFVTFPEYLDALDRLPLRLNVAVMIGHTPVRLYVMGDDAVERLATADEVEQMRALVLEAMDAGAVGFATSQQAAHVGAWGKPVPSRLADAAEIFAISDALRERNRGIIAVTSGTDFGPEQMSDLAVKTGRPVTWTALGASGRSPSAPEILAKQKSLPGEVWPQVACRPVVFQIQLSSPFSFAKAAAFREVIAAEPGERAAFYSDEQWRARARHDTDQPTFGLRWNRIYVQETDAHPELVDGPSLAELAVQRGVHPVDVLCDVALADDLATRFKVVLSNENHDELEKVLTDDAALLGLSDAGAHASQLCDAVYSTYLLQHWVRETGVLTLEKAIWKLTGQQADVLRLSDRGRIGPGLRADLVAFDAAEVAVLPMQRVHDLPAASDRLIAESRGMSYVWVNGTLIRDKGENLPASAGVLIRSCGG